MRVWKFGCRFFASLERANDWRAAGRLNREHPRPLVADPAELFHLVERFPHCDEAGAAARGIKNYVGQLPMELLGQFVSECLLTLDAIRLF